jgi:hypothetical protein
MQTRPFKCNLRKVIDKLLTFSFQRENYSTSKHSPYYTSLKRLLETNKNNVRDGELQQV